MADEETKEESTAEAPAVEEVKEEVAPEEVKAEEPKEEKAAPVEAEKPKAEVPEKFKKLIDEIDKMSVLDLSEFVKVLEGHYGVTAAAPMAMMAGAAPAGEAAEAAEEKTSFDVVLTAAGAQKIGVIKAVREIKPDLGLKEAKDLVDGAPKDVLKGVKKEEADAAKAKLEAAGATVEVK